MHIPDGFLNLPVSGVSFAASAAGIALAIHELKQKISDKLVPLMGVLAAFIFAAQMFNFPIAAGTSGHLLGGVLAAIVVGPFAATIILTVVLIVQCLLFQDGGLLALGANILNMAIVGTWLGFAIYKLLLRATPLSKRGAGGILKRAAIFLGAWISVVVASVMCSIEISASGIVPIKVILPVMTVVHSIIGIAEGIITVVVISLIQRVKPDLIDRLSSPSEVVGDLNRDPRLHPRG